MTIFKLFISTLFLITTVTASAQSVSVVDRPALGTSNNYPNYRAPLKPGRLLKLPVGSIQPRGWLKEYLDRQRDGLNGHLGEISDWLDKNNNQWLSDTGTHGWEEVPYWLRGYASLAYILNDSDMEEEAKTWFEATLRNQQANGFLGPQNTANGKPEVWAQMIMLWALQTYYEHTNDPRVLTAMKNYFAWELRQHDTDFLEDYWENKRGSDNEWSVIWYYNRTGDKDVLPLIEKLHRNTCDWTQPYTLPDFHGVNVAQGFREPATYYVYDGDSALIDNAYNNFYIMRRLYGQVPGGMYGADENARPGYIDPRQAAETCAMVEQMASDEILMGITGDPFWADHCENVAFNSFPASMTEDMKALRYLTSPNMAISNGGNHAPFVQNPLNGMLSMNPFSSRCCQHNHGMGWPYYAEHLMMATTDNGVAVMLYGANETTAKVADNRLVKITEATNYPFEEGARLTIHTDGAVAFPLYLRIPSWSDETTVRVNGKKVGGTPAAGKYLRIERVWKDGDRIELALPMKVTSHIWQACRGSVSVNYGPLTMSLKIKTRTVRRNSTDDDLVQGDSHWQQGADASRWPAYEYFPESDWNYSLDVDKNFLPVDYKVVHKAWPADNFPFSQDGAPLEIKVKGQKVPSWGFDEGNGVKTTQTLPSPFAPRDSEVESLTLIPMGAARLRISAFPKNVR